MVATATDEAGLYDPQGSETVCDDWTSSSGTAPIGNPNRTTSWSRAGLPPCDQSFHLYCFEQGNPFE